MQKDIVERLESVWSFSKSRVVEHDNKVALMLSTDEGHRQYYMVEIDNDCTIGNTISIYDDKKPAPTLASRKKIEKKQVLKRLEKAKLELEYQQARLAAVQ